MSGRTLYLIFLIQPATTPLFNLLPTIANVMAQGPISVYLAQIWTEIQSVWWLWEHRDEAPL
jgi:hypothetical protein